MFLSRNKKNNVYPCKPQFYYIKVVKEVKIIFVCFRDENKNVVYSALTYTLRILSQAVRVPMEDLNFFFIYIYMTGLYGS